ncbi:MAG: phosphate ABC transporter substrate-binding protein [Sulfuricaulis sp.]|uniref:phosphate ABC transporter substrate-binding protein n=1 Tax=Sulfuricaulis sp. TaxID=2003553 RepID=UPI0025E9E81B|nr:phosphate ABC transporter substrate-binding protein [Sulfuricaulis sp.]MCR4346026.1 phosphate ABC transporter substrate-binding protein [Sulfuricaulis sp.]
MKRLLSLLIASLGLIMVSLAFAAAESSPVTKKLTWAGCGISKNAFMAEMVAAYKKKTGIEVELKGGGATKGIREVASGAASIGGTCRHVIENPETLITLPEERRVQLIPVAWDALVVIVHKDNPVDNITFDQLRNLYLGKIANWKQLGGRDAPIELYVRQGKISGVGRTLRELVFNDYDIDFVAKHVVEESATLEKDMVLNPNGVGITGISSARKIKDIAKILKLDGKEPSYENIKNGDYLLYRPLYMVTQMQKPDPEVRKFLEFVMGTEGQNIMRSVGTVPYEDGIRLWLKYLDQQNKAIAKMRDKAAKIETKAPKAKGGQKTR